MDEAVTLMLARTKDPELTVDVGEFLLRSSRISKLWASKESFSEACDKFRTLKARPLSFTDRTSLILMSRNGIGR